jgi:hypothetical protein
MDPGLACFAPCVQTQSMRAPGVAVRRKVSLLRVMTTLINDDRSSSPVGRAAILWSIVGLLLFIFAAQRPPSHPFLRKVGQ